MATFEELQEELKLYLDDNQIAKIREAYELGAEAHAGQTRISGEPYITHPVAVAKILASMRMDPESIIAAILHDVIEDTHVDKSIIAKQFGQHIAELVDGVSKLTQMSFESKAEAQAENFRKMVLAMAKDIRVILIKLSDRLHNMRTLGSLRPDKRLRIAKETLEIYAPIANRLGMHNFHVEFEDLGFAAMHPVRYRILQAAVKKARGNRKEIMQEIEQHLKQGLAKHQLPIQFVSGREKHLYSIYKKMRNKKIPFADIMDVYAFRIITQDIDTCYRVLGAVHQLYKPVPERFKDYIAIPKANSYQSLHTTLFGPYGVPIEIQIRTKEMDQTADAGIAAHWLYKTAGAEPDQAQLKARVWLKNLMELQESSRNPIEFFESVKIDLFPDEVYVFTPKGEIMELPAGATAVDFAYNVHTDVGNSCIAAKINRRLAPLSTPLNNGQTVEIVIAPGARPNPAWLNFVVTSKARSNIRHFIKDQKHNESVLLGQQLLEKSLETLGFDISAIIAEHWDYVLHQFNYKAKDDLLEAIGLGNQLPLVVARELSGKMTENETPKQAINLKQPLMIKGSHGMVVDFAECCRPIPGDPIIGVFNAGKGLLIHLEQCKKIAKICTNPDRCIAVQWSDDVAGEFKVDLWVEVANERGVLANLASTIARTDSNIDDISMDLHDGRYNVIKLTVSVRDRRHLARIIRRIRSIKMVTKVHRRR